MIDPETGQETSVSRPSKLGIALRRYWPAVFLAALVLALVGFVVSSLMTKTYTATGEIFITESTGSDSASSDIVTQARLVSSYAVLSRVATLLDESSTSIASSLNVAAVTGANVVDVTGKAHSPAAAVALVNATYQSYEVVLGQLPESQRRDSYLSLPGVPHSPSAPHPSRSAAIGLVLGLFLAIGLAWLKEIRQPTAADTELVAERLGVPMFADLTSGRLERHSRQARTKAITALSLDLDELAPKGTRVLCLSAVRPGDLASDLPRDLAAAFAGGSWRVIVVDGDPDAALTHGAGAGGRVGLSDLVGGSADVMSATVSMGTAGLRLLPHGRRELSRAQPNLAAELRRVLGDLTEQADLVLVYVPSVGHDTEARLLAAATHGVILVIRGSTPIAAIESARERLLLFRATIIGFVRDEPAEGTNPFTRLWIALASRSTASPSTSSEAPPSGQPADEPDPAGGPPSP